MLFGHGDVEIYYLKFLKNRPKFSENSFSLSERIFKSINRTVLC